MVVRREQQVQRGRPRRAHQAALLRDRRRGRLDPHRRSAHAAHHLRAAPPTRPSSTTSSRASCGRLQRDRDYEVDEAKRTVVPTEEGIARVEQALGVENLYEHVNQNFVHQLQQALQGEGAVQARRRLPRRRRRGEDRRRVHRPHPRRPALERGSAPGGRGQGEREDQGREPDARDGHAAELLPHVRQARAA